MDKEDWTRSIIRQVENGKELKRKGERSRESVEKMYENNFRDRWKRVVKGTLVNEETRRGEWFTRRGNGY